MSVKEVLTRRVDTGANHLANVEEDDSHGSHVVAQRRLALDGGARSLLVRLGRVIPAFLEGVFEASVGHLGTIVPVEGGGGSLILALQRRVVAAAKGPPPTKGHIVGRQGRRIWGGIEKATLWVSESENC